MRGTAESQRPFHLWVIWFMVEMDYSSFKLRFRPPCLRKWAFYTCDMQFELAFSLVWVVWQQRRRNLVAWKQNNLHGKIQLWVCVVVCMCVIWANRPCHMLTVLEVLYVVNEWTERDNEKERMMTEEEEQNHCFVPCCGLCVGCCVALCCAGVS